MSYSKYPLLKKINNKHYSLENHDTEFTIKDMGDPYVPGTGIKALINSFPERKTSGDLVEFVKKLRFARNSDKPIAFYFNSGIISAGLSQLITDLMERGWISSISSDIDFMVMDFEIALAGKFIDYGSFSLESKKNGIAEETGLFLNIALKEGFKEDTGMGESVAKYLTQSKFKFNEYSILSKAYKLNIPVTIHSLPGTHPIHYHQSFDSNVYGTLSERDYILFASIISKLNNKGIFVGLNMDNIFQKVFSNSLLFCKQNNIVVDDFFFSCIDTGGKDFMKNNSTSLKKENTFYFKCSPEIMLPLITSMLLNETE